MRVYSLFHTGVHFDVLYNLLGAIFFAMIKLLQTAPINDPKKIINTHLKTYVLILKFLPHTGVPFEVLYNMFWPK